MKRCLVQAEESWLLLFDNADNFTILREDFGSIASRGRIRVTSRNKTAERLLTATAMKVLPFDSRDGPNLFTSYYVENQISR
jgi:hypothetical protein